MSEEAKTISMKEKMTPQQQAAAEKAFRKQQHDQLAAYKKRLKEGNDLKKMQVEELELNIRYYESKRKWIDLRDKVNTLDAEEQAIIQEEERKHKEALDKRLADAEAEKAILEDKPKIEIPKVGKSREE